MQPATAWTLTRDAEGIAWLALDKPGTSTNVLSKEVLLELDAQLATLEREPPRGLVLRSSKANGFVAGADVKEFTALESAASAEALVRAGQGVLDRLEALPCPTVAALHGFALGGGLELALACRYRVALGDERLAVGLPEVQLGIHPGFGGTVRAVRLLGVRAAMDLMLTGRTIRADKAERLGLVDRLVADQAALEAAAREFIGRRPAPRRPGLAERALSWPLVRRLVEPSILAPLRARARREHYPAPYAIVALWAEHGARGRAAYEAEARSIARLFMSDTSRSLVRVFLLQDRLKALGDARAPLQRVHVVGAGVMGGDIAAWCAARDLDVTLQDRAPESIRPALERAEAFFARKLRDPARVAAARARLRADVAGDGVASADVLIEAIFENLDAKRALYATLEPRLDPQALLATNTSSIVLEPLASGLQRPGRLVGLHFFNPVAQMPLVEVIHGEGTDPAAVERALGFTRRLDKLPLPCRSSPGFLVNRVLVPYLLEAMHAAAEGVPLPVIDQVALDFGMPVGPVELADVVGLDVCQNVGQIVAAALGRTPPDLARLRERVAAGKLGRKSGEGFYVWRDGKAEKPAAPGATAPPDDLADRLTLALANECVACLREGVVGDADLVDAGVVFGTGFAPFRGGPLHWARRRGVPQVVARLQELAARHGPRFSPDPGWDHLA